MLIERDREREKGKKDSPPEKTRTPAHFYIPLLTVPVGGRLMPRCTSLPYNSDVSLACISQSKFVLGY
jgi:hypothetical protein